MCNVLKPRDISKKLGCGINRTYQLIQQPDFPKIIIGKRYYILDDEFDKWLHIYNKKEYKL